MISCLLISIALVKYIFNAEERFSFMMHNNRELTLTNPNKYITRTKNHIMQMKEDDKNKSQWYYVHFLINNYSEIQKNIPIYSSNELIKNTFVLFLSKMQLQEISNISLIKKIEPNEKYFDNDDQLAKINHLIVTTSFNFNFPEINEYYTIENIKNENSYIIKIIQNELSEREFIKKKKRVIRLLSEIPEVRSISTYTRPITQNAIISGFTQKNRYDFKFNNKSNFYYLDRYLNEHGITGKDQIVTVTDTPIDFYHSMFRDDDVQFKLNTYMAEHRKIVYYNFKGNMSELMNIMEEDEHGTHVAGTTAGKSSCENDLKGTNFFNGNAPDAKILYAGHFNDFEAPDIVKLMKSYNSKVSTNSWSSPEYDNALNFEWGQTAEQNPELTFIFSSGNRYHKAGNFSTGDPPSSKNILSVGSISDFYIDYELFNISSVKDPKLSIVAYQEFLSKTDPWFKGSIGRDPGKTDILVVDLDKGDQCHLLNQNEKFVVYGQNFDWINSCNFSYLQILLINDKNKINEILESKSDVYISKIIEMNWTKKITQSFYSSTGPGNKGILKPDVMAIGTKVFSSKARAHSNKPHGCRDNDETDFVQMTGTSMATPNVAGGAILVHHYFLSGNWTEKVSLDGATTRALLINSCRHPLNSKSPDIMYGHGVVDLSTIIPIENDFGVRITNQIKKPFINENDHVQSKLKVDKKIANKDLQITLSYTDPMLNMDSPIPITRDLDLVVTSPSKKVFIGDHLSNGDTQHFSTNEKVIIRNEELEDGEYTIHIYSSHFADSSIVGGSLKQDFSVVASGPISNGYLEFASSNECPCENCDKEHPGFCLCNESIEIGPICQAKIETFHGTESAFYVGPLEMKRVRIISPKKIKYVFSKSRNPGKGSTIWVSKTCHLTLGEYETNGFTNDEASSSSGEETKVNFDSNEVCIAIFNNNFIPSNYIIDVSNSSKYLWYLVIFCVMASIILILIVVVSYLCCCRRKKCCRCCSCCKCCNKNEIVETDTVSQFSLNEKLIDN